MGLCEMRAFAADPSESEPAPAPVPPIPEGRARPPIQVRAVAEGGFFGAFSHIGEFGNAASRIDLRRTAGQDVLNFYTRWSAEFDLGRRHTLVFLYQPLTTSGTSVPSADVRIADQTFVAGVPLRTEFGFPFYRFSYLYRVIDDGRNDLQVGVTGQIRNANYTYEQLGARYSRNSDVGFVPALKIRYTRDFSYRVFGAFEADGIYAPISVLNGSDNDTSGAILDASVRAGVRLNQAASVYLNLRYLGGGASNTDPNNYSKNWLHFFFVGLGASYDLVALP